MPSNEVDESRPQQSGLQTVMRVVSVFPCFPSYTPKPDTPNLDRIKELFSRFSSSSNAAGNNNTDSSFLDRIDSNELCKWSTMVLKYLPTVDDAKNASDDDTREVVTHFSTLKKFYQVTKSSGLESNELDTLFNSLQIYEAVMSIAFVVLQDHPDILKSITGKIKEAIGHIEGYNSNGCISMACFGAAILSRFNKVLGSIDEKIGQLGIISIAEFFVNIIEVFCKFFNIDTADFQNLTQIGETLTQMIGGLTSSFYSIFGSSIPKSDRQAKYSPLAITEKIKSKLSKFENESPIVGRTVTSFENFYDSIQKVDDDFVRLQKQTEEKKQQQQQQKSSNNDQDEDTRKVDASSQLLASISNKQSSALDELNNAGSFFKHLETILSYGILLFKNEDEILNPLLDNVDECTKILKKFIGLHPLYKILCGANYLSKLKVFMKKIVEILQSSNLKFNSKREFLAELSQKYPNLLYLICDSLINDGIKKQFGNLPGPIENVVNDAINSGINKFKDKFKF